MAAAPISDCHQKPSIEQKSYCEVCKIDCTQHCSSCSKVCYCSKEHQKSHWKTHKPECFPAEVKYSSIVGRQLVATKQIKQGQLILKENPLIAGPNSGGSSGHNYYPLCLACFRIVSSKYSCSKCKWPMCGPQCETATIHSMNECPIFVSNKIPPFNRNETHMYEKIIILRGLICKELFPHKWKRIKDLESHSTERNQSAKGILLSKSAVEFIHETCALRQFSDVEIDHVVGALATNAFWNDDNVSDKEIFRSGSYLFYYGSFPAHNCVPNSSWTIQMNSEFHLRASVDIAPGEPITQPYTEITLGTSERRKHLKETKYFDCSCKRCSDSTELSTHFSSLKCSTCNDGYLVQMDPLTESSDWKCNSYAVQNLSSSSSTACGKIMTNESVTALLNGIQAEIYSVNNHNSSKGDDTVNRIIVCVNSLRNLLSKYETKILHPNHYLIYEIENIIIQRISYLLASSSYISSITSTKHKKRRTTRSATELIQLSTLMIELTRKTLHITNTILPGYTTTRGRLLYFLQQGLTMSLYLILLQNDKLSLEASSSSSELSLLNQNLNEIDKLRSEARQVLINEPEGREEYILRQKFLEEPSEYLKYIQTKKSN